jgi:hypothetical protein
MARNVDFTAATARRLRKGQENLVILVRAGDDGTNDLLVGEVIRTNELQVWFLAEHLMDVPLVHADRASAAAAND